MSYKSKSIKTIITEIEQGKIYLPALQRKFVWEKHQIQLLFDSLMRNYPIGTFLFWHLHRNKAGAYVFYEFLKEYDQRAPYNRRKTGAFLSEEITGVLDGQQRLSSLYIGLMGTHTEKVPYKRFSNDDAYEKTSLYLNLLSLPYEIVDNKIVLVEESNFEFKFLTEKNAKEWVARKRVSITGDADTKNETEDFMYWLRVGDVLSWDDDLDRDSLFESLVNSCQSDDQKMSITQSKRLINKCFETLHSRINKDETLNYFEICKDDLEDILKIFVRVNSGGTQLSKTDLLFSTIVATWDDGREKIESLLKTINNKGDKFNFTNEFLMRCCLVLTDGPVLYKVNSFKSENVQKIRDEWEIIAKAVSKTVDLLVDFGFSSSLLTSQNATIIIAYFIYKGGDSTSEESKDGIRKYLIHALLNGIYGSSQDQLITTLRNAFRTEVRTEKGDAEFQAKYQSFSFDEILKIELPSGKLLAVTEQEIDKFLLYKKGPTTFFLLSLLYPNLRYHQFQFHQDHIHPASRFTEKILLDMNIPKEQFETWLGCRDQLPNLQLLEGRQNESKNAKPLQEWLSVSCQNESQLMTFRNSNYFPENIELGFSDFLSFFNARKEKLKEGLKKVLAINSNLPVRQSEEWVDDEELDSAELQLAACRTYPH